MKVELRKLNDEKIDIFFYPSFEVFSTLNSGDKIDNYTIVYKQYILETNTYILYVTE